jgi:hypothetical protein
VFVVGLHDDEAGRVGVVADIEQRGGRVVAAPGPGVTHAVCQFTDDPVYGPVRPLAPVLVPAAADGLRRCGRTRGW